MSTLKEQCYDLGKLFYVLTSQLDRVKLSDMNNAQMYPLKIITLINKNLHSQHKVSNHLNRVIAHLYQNLSLDVWMEQQNKVIPMDCQNAWTLGYYSINDGNTVHSMLSLKLKEYKMSIAMLADKMGETDYIEKIPLWETGEMKITAKDRKKLATIFECSEIDFMV